MSDFLTLNTKDFIKGAVTAVFTAVFAAVYMAVGSENFNLFSGAHWAEILTTSMQVAFVAFMGYISKNLLTNTEGKIGGIIRG